MKRILFNKVILLGIIYILIANLVPNAIELAVYGGILKKEAEQFHIEQRKQNREAHKFIKNSLH